MRHPMDRCLKSTSPAMRRPPDVHFRVPGYRQGLRRLAVVASIIGLVAGLSACNVGSPSGGGVSVWAENRSPKDVVFVVSDNSDKRPAVYVVPARTSGHAGSGGLGSGDVEVDILIDGFCEPDPDGIQRGTIHSVRSGSVRLLIQEDGSWKVDQTPEVLNLGQVASAPSCH